MNGPQQLFQAVYGRAPTAEDRARLMATKAALGLSDRDELWGIIIALDHYTSTTLAARNDVVQLLADLPKTLKEAVDSTSAASRTVATRDMKAIIDAASKRLAQQVYTRSATTADNLSTASKTKWFIGGAIAGCAIFIAGVLTAVGAYQYVQPCIGGQLMRLTSGQEACVSASTR